MIEVEETNNDYWSVTTACKLEGRAFREDVKRLRAMVLQMITTYVDPYPRWQSADALCKELGKIDWEKELQGVEVPCDLSRLFPPTENSIEIDTFEPPKAMPSTGKFYESPVPAIDWLEKDEHPF